MQNSLESASNGIWNFSSSTGKSPLYKVSFLLHISKSIKLPVYQLHVKYDNAKCFKSFKKSFFLLSTQPLFLTGNFNVSFLWKHFWDFWQSRHEYVQSSSQQHRWVLMWKTALPRCSSNSLSQNYSFLWELSVAPYSLLWSVTRGSTANVISLWCFNELPHFNEYLMNDSQPSEQQPLPHAENFNWSLNSH